MLDIGLNKKTKIGTVHNLGANVSLLKLLALPFKHCGRKSWEDALLYFLNSHRMRVRRRLKSRQVTIGNAK